MKTAYVQDYLIKNNAIDRRMREQIVGGNVEQRGERFILRQKVSDIIKRSYVLISLPLRKQSR